MIITNDEDDDDDDDNNNNIEDRWSIHQEINKIVADDDDDDGDGLTWLSLPGRKR
jgi:hypothetical protein